MARYIDADKIDYTVTIVGRDENAGYRAVAFESDIDEMPTADVAPKSEVAREVIELIENEIKAMEDHTPTDELDKAIGLVSWILLGVVDRLKKKYTEEKE